jgi:FkbM family methyltransferase
MFSSKLRSSLRNRLKSSAIRRAYWRIANKETLHSIRQEEDFYLKLLSGFQRHDLIFDIGANVGQKTDIFLRMGARVVAVEPDSACQEMLQDRFLRYRLKRPPVSLVAKAVSDQVGVEEMWIDGPGSAVNTMNRKWADHLKQHKPDFQFANFGLDFSRSKSIKTTTIEDLINSFGVPYFVKIDVEGHELNAIRGLERPVPFLSFEVNLTTFRDEGIECVCILNRLESSGTFNYTPDCGSGLVLREWIGSDDLCNVLKSCSDETVEVFWKSDCDWNRS